MSNLKKKKSIKSWKDRKSKYVYLHGLLFFTTKMVSSAWKSGFLCIGKSNTSFIKLRMAGLHNETLKTKQFVYENMIDDLRLSKKSQDPPDWSGLQTWI